MTLRYIFLLFLFAFELDAQRVDVAASANLAYVLPQLKEQFVRYHPLASIRIVYGGSGKLAAQIERGAPYDLFLSADTFYVDRLFKKKKTLQKPRVYAQGALVMLSQKGCDCSKGLSILKQKQIEKIAIANPKTAPYGKAAKEALQRSGIYKSIKHKLVYAESISQALVYTLKATDIGFIAKSALFTPSLYRLQKRRNWMEVNATLYNPIQQGGALLVHAKNNKDARAFYEFLFSKEAKVIFEKFGYKVSR